MKTTARQLVGSAGSLRRQLVMGAGGTFALKIVNAALGLALAIVLARTLGPDGYGVYAFAFSILTLLTVPAKFGLPILLVRQIARYRQDESWGLLRGVLVRANELTLVLVAGILPTATFAIWLLVDDTASPLARRPTLLWALALLPFLALSALRSGALRGLQYAVQGQFPDLVLRQALLLAGVLLVSLAWTMTPPIAMALHVGAAAAAFGVGSVLLVRRLPIQVRWARPTYETGDWVRSVLPLSLLGGMQIITSQTDIVMLGLLACPSDVGIYRVAVQGAFVVAFSLGAVNTVAAPHYARFYYVDDRQALQRLASVIARATSLLTFAAIGTLILTAGTLIDLLFGSQYIPAYLPLVILALGQLVNAGAGSVGYLLNMSGHERITIKGITLAAVLNILLNIVLIPIFSIAGAAAATAISMATWNLVLVVAVRRVLRIDSTVVGKPPDHSNAR